MSAVLTKHLFTVEDFMRMSDAGVFRSAHVELVHGEILSTPPQGNLHAIGVAALYDALRAAFPKPHFLRIQATHRFAANLALEPDLAVLSKRPIPGALIDETPLLVVEVSDSTLPYDFETKRLLYAQRNVPEYWILDAAANVLHVFREPDPQTGDFNSAYRQHAQYTQDDTVSPLAAPRARVSLSEFLPLI